MAKVWKPKYWDTKNPPDVGSRVFVGRANGASSYETISAGQTKRILQSNGRGNIFYGNVTVYYSPLEPALQSNLPVGDYSSQKGLAGGACNFYMRLKPSGATTVSVQASYRTCDNFNFREGTLLDYCSSGNNDILKCDAPGSCDNAVALANKITIYVNDSTWYIVNIRGRTAISADIGYNFKQAYVMALPEGLDPSESVDIRTVKNAIDDAIDGGQTVRIILSNEPTWSN